MKQAVSLAMYRPYAEERECMTKRNKICLSWMYTVLAVLHGYLYLLVVDAPMNKAMKDGNVHEALIMFSMAVVSAFLWPVVGLLTFVIGIMSKMK